MKKTYLAPTVRVVPLKMQSNLLINSIDSNVGITGDGTETFEFDEDDIR